MLKFMKAYLITDQKQFMNQLLKSELFDHFLLSEALICGAVTYEIAGKLNKNFFDPEELDDPDLSDCAYIPFKKIKATIFEMIRGKHTPLSMKFVLMLSPKNLANTLAKSQTGFSALDVSAAFLNITFKDGRMTLTSAISYRTFTPDHSLDVYWDQIIGKFLTNHEISYDVGES